MKQLTGPYPKPRWIGQIRHEHHILRTLDLEGVPRALDLLGDERAPILITEDVGGVSLDRLTGPDRPALEIEPVLDLAVRLTDVLGKVHAHRFVHRDLTPGNVVWNRDTGRVQLIDFGAQSLGQVFLNLVDNACDAVHLRKVAEGTGYAPELRVATRDLGDRVEVTIRDNGPGIDDEHRGRIFDPFFSTKPSGEGTGLGLSIVHDIVTQLHGGDLDVRSEVGRYTEFTLRLPRSHRPTDSLRRRALEGTAESVGESR